MAVLLGFLIVLFSSLHTAEAAVSPSPSHHPTSGSYLRPECIRGTTHDGAGKEPTGQIQAAAG